MLDDPRLIRLQRTLAYRPAKRVRDRAGAWEAAVSIVIRPRDDLELLLIRRAERETDPWSGHMALPGGRRDPTDPDLVATAFREADEETGVALARYGHLLGMLDELHPRNPRLPSVTVAPFVVGVPPDTTAKPDEQEVSAALWVPLSALRAPEARDEILVELEEGPRAFPSFRYGEHVIWGLTHRILSQFFSIVEETGL